MLIFGHVEINFIVMNVSAALVKIMFGQRDECARLSLTQQVSGSKWERGHLVFHCLTLKCFVCF